MNDLELTEEQIQIIMDTMSGLLPEPDCLEEHELMNYSLAFKVMSNLFARSAEVHHGLNVQWQDMCRDTFYSPKVSNLSYVQEKLIPILATFWIDLVPCIGRKKGGALPGFRPFISRNEVTVDLAKFDAENRSDEL